MAAIDAPRMIYVSTGFLGRIGTAIASAIASVILWNDARVTRNALSGLSDRQLDDIGLVRGDIDALARGLRHY